jgi:hypothetical protein
MQGPLPFYRGTVPAHPNLAQTVRVELQCNSCPANPPNQMVIDNKVMTVNVEDNGSIIDDKSCAMIRYNLIVF